MLVCSVARAEHSVPKTTITSLDYLPDFNINDIREKRGFVSLQSQRIGLDKHNEDMINLDK